MPNYRQSQFKIETPKDVEQDGEISTIQNSLNHLVIPNQTDISPNYIHLGGLDGILLFNNNNALQVGSQMDDTKISYINTKLSCADITTSSIYDTGYFQNNGDAYFSAGVLNVNKNDNTITSDTNASISGFNEITCDKIKLKSGDDIGVSMYAQGHQLTVEASDGMFFMGAIHATDFLQGDTVYSDKDAYFGTTDNNITNVLHVKADVNKIVSETNASIEGINEITCNKLNYTTLSPAIPTPSKSLLTYYVDGSCGSDTNDGSREKPFKTIQSAINICELVWDGTAREVRVSFGSYNENLTISKARIQLTGSVCSRYANTACNISGTITIQISDAVDMFNSQVFITGFQIVGSVIDISSSVHTLNIKDCYLYGQENIIQQKTRGPVILNPINGLPTTNYTPVNCRTYLENLTINASNISGTTPLVSIEAGNLEMTSCNITAKSANTNCIKILNNASTSTFTSSNFTNDNTGSALKPLVIVTNISGSPTFNSFVNCGFIFGSTASKTVDVNNGNNTAIYNYSRDDYFNVLRCTFALQGVSATTTNYIIMPSYPSGGNMLLSQSGNVSSIGTAYKVCTSGVTSYPFTVVS